MINTSTHRRRASAHPGKAENGAAPSVLEILLNHLTDGMARSALRRAKRGAREVVRWTVLRLILGWIGAVVCLDITLVQSLVGSLVGAGLILGIALAYKAARKVDGMGGGDVKLMAMIGAFLGWQMVFAVLFLAAFAGSVYGVILLKRSNADGKTAVAFGSFLAPAAILMWFAGERLMALYLGSLWIPR